MNIMDKRKKKDWVKPELTVIPFKNTQSGPFVDVSEDATYSVPS